MQVENQAVSEAVDMMVEVEKGVAAQRYLDNYVEIGDSMYRAFNVVAVTKDIDTITISYEDDITIDVYMCDLKDTPDEDISALEILNKFAAAVQTREDNNEDLFSRQKEATANLVVMAEERGYQKGVASVLETTEENDSE